MTKYKELDVKAIDPSDMAQTIRAGDVITITGPKKRDKAVLEVAANKTVAIGDYDVTMNSLMTEPGVSITKIERPIPKVELPTVKGYYESARFPISVGYFALRLDAYGKWYRDGAPLMEEQIREWMPLTRLTPETEANRSDVNVNAAPETSTEANKHNLDELVVDFEKIMRRVLAKAFNL